MGLLFETHIPEDKYMATRLATASRNSRRSATPDSMMGGPGMGGMEDGGGFRPDTSMSNLSISSTNTGKRDMREKFLKYANKVLRFYAQWDDRGSMFGQKLEYVLNYYLQDDKIEVLETKSSNSGRDPFPKLVKKQRIPRSFKGVPSVGSKESDFEDQYINDQVGNRCPITCPHQTLNSKKPPKLQTPNPKPDQVGNRCPITCQHQTLNPKPDQVGNRSPSHASVRTLVGLFFLTLIIVGLAGPACRRHD
jgi:hypothetical protein